MCAALCGLLCGGSFQLIAFLVSFGVPRWISKTTMDGSLGPANLLNFCEGSCELPIAIYPWLSERLGTTTVSRSATNAICGPGRIYSRTLRALRASK